MVSVLNHFSCVWLFATLWTIARQAPLSIGFSRQEYWSGLPCSPLGHLPNPGIKPTVAYVSCIGRQVLYHWYHVGSPEWCPIHCILHCRVKRVMTGKKWANIEIRVMLHLTPSRCRFYSTNSYSTILGSQAQPVCVCVCVCVSMCMIIKGASYHLSQNEDSKASHGPDSLSRCSPRPFCQLLISQPLSLTSYSLSAFHVSLLSLSQRQQTLSCLRTFAPTAWDGLLQEHHTVGSFSWLGFQRVSPAQPPDQSPYLRPRLPTGLWAGPFRA